MVNREESKYGEETYTLKKEEERGLNREGSKEVGRQRLGKQGSKAKVTAEEGMRKNGKGREGKRK